MILAIFIWTVRQSGGRALSVPHLGILAALLMSVLGAILGVLLGLRLAGSDGIPETMSEAHPAAMVLGFLVPVGMALIEWALDPGSVLRRASRAGWFQIGLPLLGGILVIIGLLAEIVPLVTFSLPFEIIGLIVRVRRPLMSPGFMSTGPGRHGFMALVFFVVNLGILVYLIAKYFSKEIDPPTHLILALDHSIFIGVMTNGILALVIGFRRPVAAMVDHLVFAGINVGLPLFLIGLLAESAPLKQVGTPIMGLAIATALPALRGSTQDASA